MFCEECFIINYFLPIVTMHLLILKPRVDEVCVKFVSAGQNSQSIPSVDVNMIKLHTSVLIKHFIIMFHQLLTSVILFFINYTLKHFYA